MEDSDDLTPRKEFDWQAFYIALHQLEPMIETSPVLVPYLPIRIVASGGYVSLCALGNRTTTQDLDYFIDPTTYGPMKHQVQAELRRLIFDVAGALHFVPDWANDQVQMFLTLLRDPQELFERSIQQGLLLYDGAALQIYGVLWLWVLVRKMKRLQMENQPQREVDWIDCVSITKRLMEENGVPLRRTALTEFDHTDREPPVYPETVNAVNYRFRLIYNLDGFVD